MSPVKLKEEELYEMDELTEIHAAIINDDLEQLEDICQDNVDLNEKFSDEIDNDHVDMTPLALAAALNRVNQVEVLLRYGANVNTPFASLQTTALMTSSFHGHVEVVKCLLKYDANVQATDVQGSTALGYCFGGSKSIEVIELLLAAGIDVNKHNMLGMNALLLVSGYCNRNLVQAMLTAHAQPNVTNNYGHTPLHLAVLGKRSKIKKIIENGSTQFYGLDQINLKKNLKSWVNDNSSRFNNLEAGESWVDNLGLLMEEIGRRMDHVGDIREISEHDEEVIKIGLHAADKYRKAKILKREPTSKKAAIIKTILSCGGRRGGGQTDIIPGQEPMARPYQHTDPNVELEELVLNVIDETRDVVSMLIEAGCPLDSEEKTFGLTSLDVAILCGDTHSAALLTNAQPQLYLHIFKLLSMRDLYTCVSSGSYRQFKELITSDPFVDVNASFTNAHIQHRCNEEDEEDLATDTLLTPLAVAAKAKDNSTVDIIKLLIKNGADLNNVGLGNRTALCEACRWGNVKMVEFLLNQGADMETPNPAFNNATPLSIAVMHQQQATAQLLISRGAFVDVLMSDGRTSLIVAMDNEDVAMAETLLQANPQVNFSDLHSLPCLLSTNYHLPNRDMKGILSQINREAELIRLKEVAAERDPGLYAIIPSVTASIQPPSSIIEAPQRPSQLPNRASMRPANSNLDFETTSESPEKPIPAQRRKKKNSMIESAEKDLKIVEDGLVEAVNNLETGEAQLEPILFKKKKKKDTSHLLAKQIETSIDEAEVLKSNRSKIEDLSEEYKDLDHQDSSISQTITNKKLNETFDIASEELDENGQKVQRKKKKVPTATLR